MWVHADMIRDGTIEMLYRYCGQRVLRRNDVESRYITLTDAGKTDRETIRIPYTE